MLLRFASGVPYGFRHRQRLELVPKITRCTKMCEQSSQQSDQSCFRTNTRTTHTRQNKPYRLGAAPAGVVGARGRCCPAATVPAAVVFVYGVCCCIAEKKQNIIINRKTELCHHRPRSKAHSNEYENNTHTRQNNPYRLGAGAGGSNRSTRPLLSSSDGARSCRNRPRCLLLYSSKNKNKKQKQATPGISVLF